jgi:hypothetical protein
VSRDTRAALVASIAVVAVIVLGFGVLGGPGTQRLVRSDENLVLLGNAKYEEHNFQAAIEAY